MGNKKGKRGRGIEGELENKGKERRGTEGELDKRRKEGEGTGKDLVGVRKKKGNWKGWGESRGIEWSEKLDFMEKQGV